jgi:hypothetical protein
MDICTETPELITPQTTLEMVKNIYELMNNKGDTQHAYTTPIHQPRPPPAPPPLTSYNDCQTPLTDLGFFGDFVNEWDINKARNTPATESAVPTSPKAPMRDSVMQQTLELQKRHLEFMQQCEDRRMVQDQQRLLSDNDFKKVLLEQNDRMFRLEERR